MTKTLNRVAVIGGTRLPFMKMNTALAKHDLLEMLVLVTENLVFKYGLHGKTLGEVALGTTFYSPSYFNLSRDVVVRTSLAPETPAMGLQRACATSLEAVITTANKIALGQIDCAIAGGAESMSFIPLFMRPEFSQRMILSSKAKTTGDRLKIWKGFHFKDLIPTPAPGVESSTGKTMGQHCEMMAKTWHVSREEQDQLAFKSHHNGSAAFKRGFYNDLVLEFNGTRVDNNLRDDTTVEKLAKLKPSFDRVAGTLTAGNSSPLTDGAAAVFLASEDYAKAHGYPILAFVTDFETAAVDIRKEGLLMAPAYALPKLLTRNNLKLQDFDFYEIHEAFTAQVLCTTKAWESEEFCKTKLGLSGALGSIDFNKLNTVGSSVALGHPFGATGARIVATLGKLLTEKGSGRGIISICTAGGMGTVMMLEKP